MAGHRNTKKAKNAEAGATVTSKVDGNRRTVVMDRTHMAYNSHHRDQARHLNARALKAMGLRPDDFQGVFS